jgi:polyferredoxin
MNEAVTYIGIAAVLVLLSIISGRLFCGKICPLGLFQDLIAKIPFPVKIKSFKADKYLRYIKYVLLLYMVILLIVGPTVSESWNDTGRNLITIIIATALFVVASIMQERFFCKYLCYCGAMFSLGNKISPFKYHLDEKKCIQCGICTKNCGMNLEPQKTLNHPECVRCGKCRKSCPHKAIAFRTGR